MSSKLCRKNSDTDKDNKDIKDTKENKDNGDNKDNMDNKDNKRAQNCAGQEEFSERGEQWL